MKQEKERKARQCAEAFQLNQELVTRVKTMSSMDSKLQEPPPEHCPGTESKEAGNATACQGNSKAGLKMFGGELECHIQSEESNNCPK